jgi:hypothetical protein
MFLDRKCKRSVDVSRYRCDLKINAISRMLLGKLLSASSTHIQICVKLQIEVRDWRTGSMWGLHTDSWLIKVRENRVETKITPYKGNTGQKVNWYINHGFCERSRGESNFTIVNMNNFRVWYISGREEGVQTRSKMSEGRQMWLTLGERSPFWEDGNNSAKQVSPLVLRKVHCRVYKGQPLDSIISQINPVYILHASSLRSILLLNPSPNLWLFFISSPFPSYVLSENCVCNSDLSHTWRWSSIRPFKWLGCRCSGSY